MTGVASARLLAGSVTQASNSLTVVCPESYTIIVKNIVVECSTTGTGTALLIFAPVEIGPAMVLARLESAPTEPAELDLWAVLEPGDRFYVHSLVGTNGFWVSGTILSGVSYPLALAMTADTLPPSLRLPT